MILTGRRMSPLGQKYPKRLRRPAGKTTREHMGSIVPIAAFGAKTPVESRPNGSLMHGGASGRHLPEKDQTGNTSLDHFVGPDE